MTLLLLLHLARTAQADDPLTPSLADWERHLATVETLLHEADQAAREVGLHQNRWAQAVFQDRASACDDAWRAELLLASEAGGRWRDHLQAARAEARRAATVALAPTVAPLLEAPDQLRTLTLPADLERRVRAYLVSAAWQVQVAAPVERRCPR